MGDHRCREEDRGFKKEGLWLFLIIGLWVKAKAKLQKKCTDKLFRPNHKSTEKYEVNWSVTSGHITLK